MTDHIVRECPAKVNLFLRVLAREASGYHAIETLFCRVALADTLEVRRTDGGVTLEADRDDLGPAEENLAVRAARAVLDATGNRFGVSLRLTKRIPAAGGLGGGSSDAAAALLAVNALANGAMPRAELLHLAYRIGADVPFFMLESALALAWGHGQRLMRLTPLPAAPVLLVATRPGVPTATAYQWIDDARRSGGERGAVALDAAVLSGWNDIARLAGNDFESVVFAHRPTVRGAFEALANTHPLLCRMSGSGSTLFAVYRTDRDRDDAAMQLGSKFGPVIATTTS